MSDNACYFTCIDKYVNEELKYDGYYGGQYYGINYVHPDDDDGSLTSTLSQVIIKPHPDKISVQITFINNIIIPYHTCKLDTNSTDGIYNNTTNYQYHDTCTTNNFNLRLFDTSLSDDELESFGSYILSILKLFHLQKHHFNIDDIVFKLNTAYKKTYISKDGFMQKYHPALQDTLYARTSEYCRTSHEPLAPLDPLDPYALLYTQNNKTLIYTNFKSIKKSAHFTQTIVNKLLQLCISYYITPIFIKHNALYLQKPNPHIHKKTKQQVVSRH